VVAVAVAVGVAVVECVAAVAREQAVACGVVAAAIAEGVADIAEGLAAIVVVELAAHHRCRDLPIDRRR
jgi:hypothetical protein